MKSGRFIHLMFSTDSANEIAWTRTGVVAIIINAVSGMFLMAALVISLLTVCDTKLAALLVLLFGPFIGFLVSSIYSRLEWFVGNRLGGKSSLDFFYSLFPRLFLPLSFAVFVYILIRLFTDMDGKPSEAVMEIAAAVPSLVIVCFSLRNYWLNIVAVRQITRNRGAVSIGLTFILFVVLISLVVFMLLLFVGYSMNENLKGMFTGL